MKLELKHLAPYLPYGVEVQYAWWNILTDETKTKVHKLNTHCLAILEIGGVQLRSFKLILRPLSDLTKEESISNVFEHEGIEVEYLEDVRFFLDGESVWCKCDQLPYYITTLMIELGFDVFGLIDKGLAIDINTLKQA